MKKDFNSAVREQNQTPSKKILVSCFMAGYLLFTLVLAIFRPQVHHVIDAIL